jgi:energy-coupling factor transporter ATP-binding protein EcfA2
MFSVVRFFFGCFRRLIILLTYRRTETNRKKNQMELPVAKKQRVSSNGSFIFIVGPPGSGKTTLVRAFIESISPVGRQTSDKKVAWVRSSSCAVFGRWRGFHPDGASKIAGRLDGCDRLWNGAANLCVASGLVTNLLHEGATLFVADGPTLASKSLVAALERAGLSVSFLELDVDHETATARWKLRDGSAFQPKKATSWTKLRKTFGRHAGWKKVSHDGAWSHLMDVLDKPYASRNQAVSQF